MSSDPQTRPRRDFSALSKLANAPATADADRADRDEGSGLIHLAALEASARATASPSPPSVPSAAPVETEPRPLSQGGSRRRHALAGAVVFGSLVVGGLLGSMGAPLIREASPTGDPAESPSPAPRVASSARMPRGESEREPLKLPLAAAVVEAPAMVSPELPPPVAPPSPPAPSLTRESSPFARAPSPESTPPARANSQERRPTAPAESAASPPRSARSLAEHIEEAAGDTSSPQGSSPEVAAPTNPDGVAPAYPSLGAINSAMLRVIREAQACVEGDLPISHASVRFNSTGVVEAVTVTGWAAGKPAEACVRSALMKARVAPFIRPSYVVPVTIRSN
jgi:hypothetical protein